MPGQAVRSRSANDGSSRAPWAGYGAKSVVIGVAEIVVLMDSLRLNLAVEWLQWELRTLQGIDLATGQFRFWPPRIGASRAESALDFLVFDLDACAEMSLVTAL